MEQVPNHKGRPVWKPKGKGLGISDWIVDRIGVRPATWKPILVLFRLIVAGSKKIDAPIFGPIYKRLMMFNPVDKRYSSGTVYNLNVDLSKEGESVVLPMDLIKDTLRKASYIASTDVCLCRDANDCQDYPKDVCCLFLSNSGRRIVDHKVGYEISLDDALARVDQAAELGLVGQALWVEVEQFIWGLTNADMEHFIEICFCCPCCCVAFNISKNASRDVKSRFSSSGWTAKVVEDACTGCGACVEPCPQAAITMGANNIIEINQEFCVGCGICKKHCMEDAIRVTQTRPMLESVQEYFLEDGRLALRIDG